VAFDPSRVQVLLVGPRVAHLAPFFERRGYQTVAETDGTAASEGLQMSTPDLILLELSLGPMSALDFVALARGLAPNARMLLLEDVSRAGHIVKALLGGVHGYVPTPPDENKLFEQVESVIELSPRFRRSDADITALETRAKNLEQNLQSAVKRAETAEQAVHKSKDEVRAVADKLEAAEAEVEEKKSTIAKLRGELEKAPKPTAIAALEKKIHELESIRDEKLGLEKTLKERGRSARRCTEAALDHG
jgi:DNA-binding NarL/FixJ family response regulator